jgi:peptidoglycan hydrolase-like amidase
MKMADYGYNYSQILGYYYKGVSLVPITSVGDLQK